MLKYSLSKIIVLLAACSAEGQMAAPDTSQDLPDATTASKRGGSNTDTIPATGAEAGVIYTFDSAVAVSGPEPAIQPEPGPEPQARPEPGPEPQAGPEPNHDGGVGLETGSEPQAGPEPGLDGGTMSPEVGYEVGCNAGLGVCSGWVPCTLPSGETGDCPIIRPAGTVCHVYLEPCAYVTGSCDGVSPDCPTALFPAGTPCTDSWMQQGQCSGNDLICYVNGAEPQVQPEPGPEPQAGPEPAVEPRLDGGISDTISCGALGELCCAGAAVNGSCNPGLTCGGVGATRTCRYLG